jgi:4-amino-4-deoxy-L-arabinose transferase-like glycosyltransferase
MPISLRENALETTAMVGTPPSSATDPRRRVGPWAILGVVLLVAAAIRLYHLGQPCFGYDEVVQMMMARQEGPAALFRLLSKIEATRAPLHPLVLQAWISVFGPSEFSARALSVLCGLATVGLISRIGRDLFDTPTALWASAFATVSPVLVQYSQEAKMYAWLVFWTCLAWWCLLSFRQSAPWGKQVAFGVCLVVLSYSYPLGLFMVLALGLAYLVHHNLYQLSLRQWIIIHMGWAMVFTPWLPHYMDHPPEIVFERSWRNLTPWLISFTGGNGLTLVALFFPLFVMSLVDFPRKPPERIRPRLDLSWPTTVLLIWFAVPPGLLLAYSLVANPIFGAPRYVMFVAPAYLLLLARGLMKLPAWLRWPIGGLILVLAVQGMVTLAFDPRLKPDYRAAAQVVREHDPKAPVVVFPSGEKSPTLDKYPQVVNFEYYLDSSVRVAPVSEVLKTLREPSPPEALWYSFPTLEAGRPAPVPERLEQLYEPVLTVQYPGLRLVYNRLRSLDSRMR